MKPQDSSMPTGLDPVSVVCGALALLATSALNLHLALAAKGATGVDLSIGWIIALGVVCLGVVTSIVPDSKVRVLTVALPIVLVLSLIALLSTGSSIALSCFIFSAVGWSMATPLTEWACGTGENKMPLKVKSFALTSGKYGGNPIPSALVLGILVFALPSNPQATVALAMTYVASILMLASLGHLRIGARKLPGQVEIDYASFGRWIPIALIMLLLCTVGGLGIPMALAKKDGPGVVSGSKGLVSFKATDQAGSAPLNGPEGQTLNPKSTGLPGHEKPGKSLEPMKADPKAQPIPKSKPPPETPKEKQDKLKDQLLKLVGLGLLAAAVMWIARKYGPVITRFVKNLVSWLIRPVQLAVAAANERRRERLRDRAIKQILLKEPDPYQPLKEDLVAEDLPAIYERLLAFAGLHGLEPKTGETTTTFFKRLATSQNLDLKDLATVDRACTAAQFAAIPPGRQEVQAAKEAADRLCQRLTLHLTPTQFQLRQVTYRRNLAERRLDEKVSA